MSYIRAWALRHHVSLEALVELEAHMGLHAPHGALHGLAEGSESRVMGLVRLEAAKKGARLFRNNSGALKDATGRLVRYGLGNDNAQLNKILKSPDLVGWQCVTVTPDMVGTRIAQFLARECKAPGWHYSGDDHERAQLSFIELCVRDGGDAAFCTGEGTL